MATLPLDSGIFGSNRGKARKDVVSAGLVTFNVASSERIAEFRLKNAATMVSGSYWGPLLGKGPDANHRLHVRPWQPLLTYRKGGLKAIRNAVATTNGRNIASLAMPVFSSFNLHERKEESEIYEEIEALGFSADWMVYGEPTQIDSGLACVVAGSFTTTNTGTSNWTPGMLIKWMPPPRSDADLEEFRQAREKAHAITPEYPANYFPPRLEPFDFERDVRQSIRTRIRNELPRFEKNFDEYMNFSDLDLGKPMSADKAFFMRRLRAEIAHAAYRLETTRGLEQANTFARAMGLVDGVTPSGDDKTMVINIARSMYTSTERPPKGTARRSIYQGEGDVFALECEAIHRACQVVLCKSIGFALPGAGGDVVV
jgi:hypothetical protein